MKFFKSAIAFAMILTGGSVAANTVTFDELASDVVRQYTSIVSGGFEFTDSCVDPVGCFYIEPRSSNNQADPGAAAVVWNLNTFGNQLVMRRVGGGTFDLHSIDFTDEFNGRAFVGFDRTVAFTFTSAGGAISQQSVAVNNFVGLETLVLDKSGLQSVSWTGARGDGGAWTTQFDNVTWSVTAVPEPETYALMLAGLARIGVVARRRKA
jgi:hypothetical protein